MLKGQNALILVAEDEPLIALDIEDVLRNAGYANVVLAVSNEEGLQLLETLPMAIALLDIHLKDGRSDQLAYRLEEMEVSYICLTAMSDDEVPEPFNTRRVVTKPFGVEQLLGEISDLFVGSRQRT